MRACVYLTCHVSLSHLLWSHVVQVVKYMKEKAAEAERQRQRALEKARGESEGEGWMGDCDRSERTGIVEGRFSGRDTYVECERV